MSTIKKIGTVITARDLDLLRTLVVTRVLDAEQVKTVAGFSSIRRTNRRLLKLVNARALRRWFLGTASGGQKALYGLSPQGAALIGETTRGLISWKQDTLITTSQFLTHQQAINEVFMLTRFQPLLAGVSCKRWINFREPVAPSVAIIPDGYFEMIRDGTIYPAFLEVDLGTEGSKAWRQKAERYLAFALGGEFERKFYEKRFRVLVVLPSLRRLETVRHTVARRTEKLFWFSTLDDLRTNGLFAPIWVRPVGAGRIPLL